MNFAELDKALDELRKQMAKVIEDRDSLRAYLSRKAEPVDAGKVGAVLRDALNAKAGWQEEARAVLGLQRMITCEYYECGNTFPSGGKRRKYCSEECRKLDY